MVRVNAEGLTVTELIKTFFMGNEDKPIVDKTGLTGKFDFHLEYAINPSFRKIMMENQGIAESEFPTGPTFEGALQEQLGLKLEPTKGPWEHMIIDHIEKPTEN
jgi:uncharacterized protein (TIGR03435 family)